MAAISTDPLTPCEQGSHMSQKRLLNLSQQLLNGADTFGLDVSMMP